MTDESPDSRQPESGFSLGPPVTGALSGLTLFGLCLVTAGPAAVIPGVVSTAIVAVPVSLIAGLLAGRFGTTGKYSFALSLFVCLLLCVLMSCNITR